MWDRGEKKIEVWLGVESEPRGGCGCGAGGRPSVGRRGAGEVVRRLAAPTAGRARVQVCRVDDPDDEGPDLLGVPVPVGAPGLARPDRTGDEGEGPQREGDDVHGVGQALDV